MAYRYSQESEELTLPYQNGSGQLPIAKSNDTPPQSYSVECLMELYLQLQSSPMSQSLQEKFYQASTSFTEDSHVKTLALQDAERAWKESEADYFSRSCALSMKFDRRSSSWKMCQLSLLEDLERSPQKLPSEAMIVDGQCYPLRKLERITKEKDGGYWATPTARNAPDCPAERLRKSPSLEAMVQMWRTPTVNDSKNNGSPSQALRDSPNLNSQVGGKLNPMWVEWLMNYPTGWTELNALGMQLCPCKQKKRLKD